MKDLKSRLEAKRDAIANEKWGGCAHDAAKAGANEFIPMIVELAGALECWETFHSLGGIDDCKPCLAKAKLNEWLGGE